MLIEQALQQAQIGREEIQRLGIGIGPGSYTGIRSAIAVAQGWQLARDTELCAVSSAETLAATARGKDLRGETCLLYTSPSPRDKRQSRMPSSA